MGKLIQVSEAAERLGVNRQTIENWGKRGAINIKVMKGRGNAHWVDADTIEALQDIDSDAEKARKILESDKKEAQELWREVNRTVRQYRRQIVLVNRYGQASLVAKDFYLSIPQMLEEIGIINCRESRIMQDIISGDDLENIGERLGLSVSRVLQLFHKGCQRAADIYEVKDKLQELERLRAENSDLQAIIKTLRAELKNQEEEEALKEAKTEEERREAFIQTDSLCKMFNTKLVDCELSVRALNCLKSIDCETIGDLCRMSKIDLLKCRNFGKKSLGEIDDFLYSRNLDYNTDVDHVMKQRLILYEAQYKDKED